jgi:hypothetical protein
MIGNILLINLFNRDITCNYQHLIICIRI